MSSGDTYRRVSEEMLTATGQVAVALDAELERLHDNVRSGIEDVLSRSEPGSIYHGKVLHTAQGNVGRMAIKDLGSSSGETYS